MDFFIVLKWVGGVGYLLNKVFFSFAERMKKKSRVVIARRWRIAAWFVYLIGLPPWVILFASWRNWIAAGVELSGGPSMLLGLIIAVRGSGKKPPRWLDRGALFLIPIGFLYSLYDFGGFTSLNQLLEVGLVIGFLLGTYQLAKQQRSGYLWFVVMHISCAWLMLIQDSPWLYRHQIISLVFILDAYLMSRETS